MSDVFISYHRSDSASALVRQIADELKGKGISCWYDAKDPKLGSFTKWITKEIEQCKVFLLLWDEGANKSRYCIAETHYAFNYAKRALIVPFQVGDFERDDRLSLYTGPFQILFGGESEETAPTDELIRKISAEFGKTPEKIKIITLGKCGDKVAYELNENGVLTISGEGSMRDFEWNSETQTCNIPWWNEREMISHVHILNGVNSIGEFAFLYCKELISVDISDSVTFIGSWAFTGCEKLKSVSVLAGTKIKNDAFPPYTEVIRRPQK